MSETKNGNGEAHDTTTSVFIGLGPAASTISEDMLRERLAEVTEVLGVRIRGRCAFADVTDAEAADKLVAELDGKMIGEARMAVQISRSKEKERPAANAGSNKHANNNNTNSNNNHNNSSSGGGGGRTSLFVGLGPAGGAVSDNELREKLELAVPILAFRRRGQCAFVDVANMADANRMIRELNNQYIGECRLSVQYSRDNKRSRSVERRSRSPARRRRRQRSRRSDSPDRRRRRHSRSYSSRSSSSRRSSSDSGDSRDYRRRDRHRRRDRSRSRSRSYSSRSRSSSHSYRRRRD